MRCGVCAGPFIPSAIKLMTTETGMLAPSDREHVEREFYIRNSAPEVVDGGMIPTAS